jgi:hypothetical protein
VRIGRDAENARQEDQKGRNRNDQCSPDPEDIASVDYWNEEKETVYVVHTVEEIQAQGFPASKIYQLPKIVK